MSAHAAVHAVASVRRPLGVGYTGLLSFGHAAFFGGAGYAAGHAMLEGRRVAGRWLRAPRLIPKRSKVDQIGGA